MKYYYSVSHSIEKTRIVLAKDVFQAIAIVVEKDNYKYPNSEYKAKKTKL